MTERPLCGPCSLGVHVDCHRLDGDECGCTQTPTCGAALRVFSASPGVERLWDAIDRLWGWMGVDEVRAIRADDPELADLAVHAHHRMSHEQRTMR